jgi:hypothetical protein
MVLNIKCVDWCIAITKVSAIHQSQSSKCYSKTHTICGQQKVCVRALGPPNLVDLLLDLQALEVVELGLV